MFRDVIIIVSRRVLIPQVDMTSQNRKCPHFEIEQLNGADACITQRYFIPGIDMVDWWSPKPEVVIAYVGLSTIHWKNCNGTVMYFWCKKASHNSEFYATEEVVLTTSKQSVDYCPLPFCSIRYKYVLFGNHNIYIFGTKRIQTASKLTSLKSCFSVVFELLGRKLPGGVLASLIHLQCKE